MMQKIHPAFSKKYKKSKACANKFKYLRIWHEPIKEVTYGGGDDSKMLHLKAIEIVTLCLPAMEKRVTQYIKFSNFHS